MRNYLVYFLFFICFFSKAQVGVVTDPDGYLNVRDKPNGKIIDKLTKGEIFFINIDMQKAKWKEITYGTSNKIGFVHHSKIAELSKFNTSEESIPQLCFKTDKVTDSKNREFVGGMNLPLKESFEIVEIELIIGETKIKQKSEYVDNVLTPFLPIGKYCSTELAANNKMQIYSYDQFNFYRMKLGDGSEYYESIWVVKNGEIVQRLIGCIT